MITIRSNNHRHLQRRHINEREARRFIETFENQNAKELLAKKLDRVESVIVKKSTTKRISTISEVWSK